MLNAVLSRGVCCPSCHGRLDDDLACRSCGAIYPRINGIPALLDPEQSLFDPLRVSTHKQQSPWKSFFISLLPSLTASPPSARNYQHFTAELLRRSDAPRALVVGGARTGRGMAAALADRRIDWVETDVIPGDRAAILCDVHQIPFEDGSFDGVVAQAVLEHVVDPVRAVAEIWRVLAPGGLVYAETPFLQHVHAGPYDFTRYTHLGHRRLFRRFREIDSGAASGPGTALAWAWRGFLQSLAPRHLATITAHLSAFWLPYLDRFLCRRPAAFDCASSYYFLGAKSSRTLTDAELIAAYRGLQRG